MLPSARMLSRPRDRQHRGYMEVDAWAFGISPGRMQPPSQLTYDEARRRRHGRMPRSATGTTTGFGGWRVGNSGNGNCPGAATGPGQRRLPGPRRSGERAQRSWLERMRTNTAIARGR